MDKSIELELFDTILNGDSKIYEFINSEYYRIDKEIFRDVLLEYIYRAERLQNRDEMIREIYDRLGLESIILEEIPDIEKFADYFGIDIYTAYIEFANDGFASPYSQISY